MQLGSLASSLGLLIVCSCGRVQPGTPDARSSDANVMDARAPDAPPGPACDLGQPFGTPEPIAGVNSESSEINGSFSKNRLTIYFVSDRDGDPFAFDIYYATRSSTDAAFDTPMLVPNINHGEEDGHPVLSDDGLTLYFGSRRGGTDDIYVATRNTTASQFGGPELLLNVNDVDADDYPSHINEAGTALTITSNRAGSNDVYRATRAEPSGPFGTPIPIAELNDLDAADAGAALTGDDLTVFIDSNRTGGVGEYDIWMARRTTTESGFGDLENVAELNTVESEWPTWLSADGCHLLMGRATAGTGLNLYQASRPES